MVVPQPNALPQDAVLPLTEPGELWTVYKVGIIDDAKEFGEYGHLWRWNSKVLKALIESLYRKSAKDDWPGLKWELVGEEDPDSKVGNGFWLAYRLKE
jgi:hypothetical protein